MSGYRLSWGAVLLDGNRLVPVVVDSKSFSRVFSGLDRIEVERFEDGRWLASVYWTQLPAYPHQGKRPIRYAHGEFGATPWEAAARLREEMGLSMP